MTLGTPSRRCVGDGAPCCRPCRMLNSFVRPSAFTTSHFPAQALLESASRELGAMRHLLAADELVNNFDMFGALIELHGAQTCFSSWASSVTSVLPRCHAHFKRVVEASDAASRSTGTRATGGFWSFLTGGGCVALGFAAMGYHARGCPSLSRRDSHVLWCRSWQVEETRA